ncbi:NmrA-like family protein [Geodermatophilus amargosae]|uniref:NmrA-like family protein n=1 Tax=Geodermatophilus amargosae TaxID=1296565 RepID=A0A1I6ZT59_9ACTN|nr:NmrA-like family protein [Geodermatophilus amargosae]
MGPVPPTSPLTTVLLAGATGDLGGRLARELLDRGAVVRALTRPGSDPAAAARVRGLGATVVVADYADPAALQEACAGADVVVSAVSGLRPVVVDAQSRLLDAAVAAGVPRFVPSDFSADHRTLPPGTNRNLELRREFMLRLDAAPIRATSVLNGAFADMLTGQAPLVLFDRGRVLYWGAADQPLDFTTKDDVAGYTADAVLDPGAPRFLQIAGDSVSSRDLAETMTRLTGRRFRPLYAGGVPLLRVMAGLGRRIAPAPGELYPAWQGMQYFDSMFSGDAKLHLLANDRYGPRSWTTAEEVLAAHLSGGDRAAA